MLQGKALTVKSLDIAYKAHDGQYRRDGRSPYITHPIEVAMRFNNPILKSISYLHDVLEDSGITIKYLLEQGIPPIVVNVVIILTKNNDEKYLDYILRIKGNQLYLNQTAILVKIEDIKHNHYTSHKSKQERYDMALYILKGEK